MNWSNNHDRCTAMMHDCKNKRLVPGSDVEGRVREDRMVEVSL